MHVVEVSTPISAPAERCFDLARSVEVHLHSTPGTAEEIVAGRRSGLFELGEVVTWRATHLGVRQSLRVRIAAMDRPRHFRDEQVAGAFKHFEHDHWFEPDGAGGAQMRDRFAFTVPYGPLGAIVGAMIVAPHLRRFLTRRALAIKEIAESEGWRRFLTETTTGRRP